MSKIMATPILRNDIEDKKWWGPDLSGNFSTETVVCLEKGLSLALENRVPFN